MNMKKNWMFFALTLLIGLINQVQAQTDAMNHSKYWYYRWRLLNDFMVVGPTPSCPDGNCQGHSIPATIRMPVAWDRSLEFGEDGTIALGYYLAVLATEYHLLDHYGEDLAQTKKEIYYALKAINRLDLGAETYMENQCGGSCDCWSYLNGFFIRGDVTEDFFNNNRDHFNQNKTRLIHTINNGSDTLDIELVKSVYLWSPQYKAEMSQDQAISLLFGLRLIKEFVDLNAVYEDPVTGIPMNFPEDDPSIYSLQQEAKEITSRILSWIDLSGWNIRRPECIDNGSFVQTAYIEQSYPFRFPMSEIGCQITSESYMCNNSNPILSPGAYAVWQVVQSIYNLPAYGNDGSFIVNKKIVLELTASMGAHSQSIRDQIYLIDNGNDPMPVKYEWYALLHGILANLPPPIFWPYIYIDYINTAPCLGPFKQKTDDNSATWPLFTHFNWTTPSLLTKSEDRVNENEDMWTGEFNGLDYMLLYNLFRIKALDVNFPVAAGYGDYIHPVIPVDLPFYTNPNTTPPVIGNHANPIELQGFETITSSKIIDSDGDVTFRAGFEIILEPGFQVTSGADFHAYIDKFECDYGDNYYRNVEAGGQQVMVTTLNDASKIKVRDRYQLTQASGEETTAINTDFVILPNPNNGMYNLSIHSRFTGLFAMQVLDMTGKILLSKTLSLTEGANLIPIDQSGLSSGIYFVHVDGFTETKKMIVTR
jgi:hypothetical protein